MFRMFVRHSVSDYAAWRKVYDAFHEIRKQAGVISEAVYQLADNPNDITLILDFETLDAARAFPDNPELKAAYDEAGSIGAPDGWVTRQT